MNSTAIAFNERYGLNVSTNAFEAADLNQNVANDLIGKPKRNSVQTLKRFFSKPTSVFAVVVFLVVIALAIAFPLLSPHGSVRPIVDRAGENQVFSNLPPAGQWITRLLSAQQLARLQAFGMVEGVDYVILNASDAGVTGQVFVNYDVWKYATNVAKSGDISLAQVSVLGTDSVGRDVWTRTWDGTWESIKLGLFSALGSAVLGTVLGCLVGLRYGSAFDIGVNRLIDAYTNIPYLVWVSLLLTAFPQSFGGLIGFFIITSWVVPFSVARFNIIRFLNTDYIKVAKISGVSPIGRVLKHALPNFIGIIAITTMGLVTSTIVSQAYIGILGFTFQAEAAYLGNVLQEMLTATTGVNQNLLFVLIPTILLVVIILSTRYIALGINDAVDPKLARR